MYWHQCLVGEDRQVKTGEFTRTCRVEKMLCHCNLSKQNFNSWEVVKLLQTQSSQDQRSHFLQKLRTIRIKLQYLSLRLVLSFPTTLAHISASSSNELSKAMASSKYIRQISHCKFASTSTINLSYTGIIEKLWTHFI